MIGRLDYGHSNAACDQVRVNVAELNAVKIKYLTSGAKGDVLFSPYCHLNLKEKRRLLFFI
jgi:hypothetical protein